MSTTVLAADASQAIHTPLLNTNAQSYTTTTANIFYASYFSIIRAS